MRGRFESTSRGTIINKISCRHARLRLKNVGCWEDPCRIDSMCKEHEKAETKGRACASKAVVQVVQLQGRLSLLWSVQLL